MKKKIFYIAAIIAVSALTGCKGSTTVAVTTAPTVAATSTPVSPNVTTQKPIVNNTSNAEGTLGITTKEFVAKCNEIIRTDGLNSVNVMPPTYEDKDTAYIQTSEKTVSLNALMKNGYINMLMVNYTYPGDITENYIDFACVLFSSITVFDSSTVSAEFGTFISDLMTEGHGAEQVYNGLKYRADVEDGSITVSVRK